MQNLTYKLTLLVWFHDVRVTTKFHHHHHNVKLEVWWWSHVILIGVSNPNANDGVASNFEVLHSPSPPVCTMHKTLSIIIIIIIIVIIIFIVIIIIIINTSNQTRTLRCCTLLHHQWCAHCAKHIIIKIIKLSFQTKHPSEAIITYSCYFSREWHRMSWWKYFFPDFSIINHYKS